MQLFAYFLFGPYNPFMKYETNNLGITGVYVGEELGGIPFKDLSSVKNALNIYAATGKQFDSGVSLEDSGQFKSVREEVTGLYSLTGSRYISPLVSEMFEAAQRSISRVGWWHRSFEYENIYSPTDKQPSAQYPFVKVDVEIRKLLEEGYMLSLAGDTFENTEENLANRLDVERGLASTAVLVALQSKNGMFLFDYDEILRRLRPVLADLDHPKGSTNLSGSAVVTHMIESEGHPIYLGARDGIYLQLDWGLWSGRFRSDGKSLNSRNLLNSWKGNHNLWIGQGSILTGPMETSSRQSDASLIPSIYLIARRSYQRWIDSYLPAFDPVQKVAMRTLTERVANAFMIDSSEETNS